MYFVQRWKKDQAFAPDDVETVIQHEVKAIAEVLGNIAENVEGSYYTRVISKRSLEREGKAAVLKAESDLKNAKDLQEKLWLELRSSSAFHPLHKVTRATDNLMHAEEIAQDEVHQAVKNNNSLRDVGEAAKLSHERVRQIYNAADKRLTELIARCVNGHQWAAYKYYFGIAPEECPTCKAIFADIESPIEKPLFQSPAKPPPSTVEIVAVDSIDGEMVKLKDGSYRSVIKVEGIALSKWNRMSKTKQDIVLGKWREMLDSLTTEFPIQIIAHSNKTAVKVEIEKDDTMITMEQTVPAMQNQLQMLQEKLEAKANKRSFYVVVSAGQKIDPVKLETKATDAFKSLLNKGKKSDDLNTLSKDEAKMKLDMHLMQLHIYFKAMGLESKALADKELIDLYHSSYNPNWRSL